MPTWEKAPNLDDTLTAVWQKLSEEVGEMPSMESVVGVSAERLSEHATQAVLMMAKMDSANPMDPTFWIRLYALGFVVGCKFSESRK